MSCILGIDPGDSTGCAIYRAGKLVHLETIAPEGIADYIFQVGPTRVIFEDSRLQTKVWTPAKGAAALKVARNIGDVVKYSHRKTIAIRFDSLKNGGTSRNSARNAAFLIQPPVLAARMGGRKPCRLASAVPGLSTHSSRRPHLTVSAPVFKPELSGENMKKPPIADSVLIDRVRELLDYDAVRGALVWRVNISNIAKGRVAGTKNGIRGYRQVRVDGRIVMEHRLVWFHVNGVWPTGEIDHINGIHHDNRIENLRDVSAGVNMQNLRIPRSTNKVGLLGVTRVGKKFRATIRLNRVAKYLGLYDTPELAHEAYVRAKRLMHMGCTI